LGKGVSPGEYLAFLSVKHEVDPDELFYALISAEKNQKSKCGSLSIQCRSKTQDEAMLLILKGHEVVAQFPVSMEFLSKQSHPIKDFMKNDMVHRYLTKKSKGEHSLPIRDLRAGMKQINLKARVVEIAKPTFVLTRFGNHASVAKALISDETGTIKLCLWNEQIDLITTGDTIQVENARTSTFRGERELSVGKKGTLSSIGDHCAVASMHGGLS
jgi:replication factor A1